jgi:hypothetical protein
VCIGSPGISAFSFLPQPLLSLLQSSQAVQPRQQQRHRVRNSVKQRADSDICCSGRACGIFSTTTGAEQCDLGGGGWRRWCGGRARWSPELLYPRDARCSKRL